MKKNQQLSRRIVVAFVLMAAVISALFSVGIVVVVQVVEHQLLSNTLHDDLTLAMARYSEGRELNLLPGSSFYHEKNDHEDQWNAPPEWLKDLSTGFHEVFRDGQAYHALVYKQGDEKFLFLRDQTNLERREQALYLIVAAGFLVSVIVAWILGYFLARRIMSPVSRLAQQVRDREQNMTTLQTPLVSDYAADEVGQLAVAFDDALNRVHGALERERFFTSDVSHELRTPLTVVTTACELLQASNHLNEKQLGQLARIQRAAQEMRDLVHTFLQLARDNLSADTSVNTTTLEQMAHEQCEAWLSVAVAKQLSLSLVVESSSALPDQRFNTALLRAVMSNLIRNAVHYTDSGSVRLVLTKTGFRVEDTGKNIEECRQEAIFQPFVRGSAARGEGLGLGLSLVRRICAHEGWNIRLYNLLAGGNCFEVLLY
ncbi:MAG TPA: HAMP domain-containing sensor histidine kinase [Pseudomonadales bacterium]|jgi:signal transduction histidine kinase|nr:HAMP domain-containing sensor histidine kinase [Pseudomonadales bacterium]HNN86791.1 HAMP domain-containing sensor histidine kinase [Pseudomonadales bacterium]